MRMASIRVRLLADGGQPLVSSLMLRPASTRMRVLSVASSAQLPELPLASTQNLTMRFSFEPL